jgi:pantetheine-phosphate adenylyltransferase
MSTPVRRLVYAGTFDPIHLGHLDIIERGARQCDELVVAVVIKPGHKKTLFSADERIALVAAAVAHVPNVRVIGFNGLLVRFALEQEATGLLRGMRSGTDFDYESQIGQLNASTEPTFDTVYMITSPERSFCSSSAVRELHSYQGDVRRLVPACVYEALQAEQNRAAYEQAQS